MASITQEGDLKKLESESRLSKAALWHLKNVLMGKPLVNKYACVLAVLGKGYDAIGTSYSFESQQTYAVDRPMCDYVVNVVARQFIEWGRANGNTTENSLKIVQKTPGWQQMSTANGFDTPPHNSKVGFLGFQLPMLPNSPVSGPDSNVPPLCEQALNRIHPDFTKNLEKFCGLIRSRAYLALPAMAFGSLQRVVGSLTGVVGALGLIINQIYQGAIRIIQMFYSWINGKLQEIQRWLIWLIEQLVPIDLLCEILEAIQVLLDDINFFTSLFSQSASIFGFLNQIQNYVNIASSILTSPLAFIQSFLPPEILNIIDLVNQVGSDPNGFITDMLSNYGYAWAAEALQGNLVAALVDKFGPQFRAIGPISALINNAGLSVPSGNFGQTPASMLPAWGSGSDVDPVADLNMNPIDGAYKILQDTQQNVSDALGNLGAAVSNVGDTLQAEGEFISKIPSKISKALGDIF